MLFMGGLDALGHLDGNADGLFPIQTSLFGDVALKGDALHQLHDDKMDIALVHNVVNADDVGMGQTCRRLGLHLEFADKIGIVRKFCLQDLDGHQAV